MDIKNLIRLAGGTTVVARACGISSQAVSQWTQVPVERCIAIERATDGAVTRAELRPDIFGDMEQRDAA